MQENQLREAHYILPMENLPSVLQRGILSHHLAKQHSQRSIAMDEVQQRRAVVELPSGRKLHTYANLYINARNTMMYCRRDLRSTICVLRISPRVLHIDGTYISDKNAAAGWPLFEPSPGGLRNVDFDRVYAKSWNHVDEKEKLTHKAEMCAEILVPDRVPRSLIDGAYVCGNASIRNFQRFANGANFPVVINSYIFFGYTD